MTKTGMNADLEVFKHYEELTKWCQKREGQPTPWVTMLYGSQNYGLESADSDVDTKTMLLPSLKMVVGDTKRISTEVVMPDGSLDNCKDLREMFENYLKGNINFVETLYTRYYTCTELYHDEYRELREQRDLIANAQPRRLLHMAAGMAKQKYEAFEHPFEGKKDVLAKWGYDPKQLHHLVRLYYFMAEYYAHQDFESALLCCHKQVDADTYKYVMGFKVYPYPYQQAKEFRDHFMERVDGLVAQADAHTPTDNGYEEAKAFLHGLALRLITKHLRKEVLATCG